MSGKRGSLPARWLWLWLCCISCCCSSPPQLPASLARSTNVSRLPGFHGPLPFSLQTGYVDVEATNGVQLFYYFIPSERTPEEDPLLLWLTGGPGCSAFSGLVYEIGPLSFDVGGYVDGLPNLVYKSDSWTKVSNVIFLDSPVGTGFSYAATEEGYKSSDTKAVEQIVIFMRKWLDGHPQFMSNPLYIGGDSYSGLIVPIVAFEIARGIEMGHKPVLNLQGYLVGNPVTDGKFDYSARYPFGHGMALISDELYELYKESCSLESQDNSIYQSVQCSNCLKSMDESLEGINKGHILEPLCVFASPHPQKQTASRREMLLDYSAEAELQLSEISSECRTLGFVMSRIWANNDTVREALGIHKGTVPSWMRCNYEIPYTKDITSAVKYHSSVTTKGYRSLIYSGDHDLVMPFVGTQAWIRSLDSAILDDWRPWYVGGQVAGFTRSYSNNLTFATVKGAGHTAPEYKPKECLAMLARWLSGDPL